MKVAGYINEHGAKAGFVKVVLSDPPDNRMFIFGHSHTAEKPAIIPISEVHSSGYYIREDKDIPYEQGTLALIGFILGEDVIVGNLNGVLLTLNERLDELDPYPVLKFSVVELIYSKSMTWPVVRTAFQNAKIRIVEKFGLNAAENWQNTQVILPAILTIQSLPKFSNIEVTPIADLDVKSNAGKNNAEISVVKGLKVTITVDRDFSFSKREVDLIIADTVARYRDDLLVQVSYRNVFNKPKSYVNNNVSLAREQYTVIDTFHIHIDNESNSDQPVSLKAVVLQLDGSERYQIRYSHTMIPTEHSAGPWYSDSMTNADSRSHAKALITNFARRMERAYKIVSWDKEV